MQGVVSTPILWVSPQRVSPDGFNKVVRRTIYGIPIMHEVPNESLIKGRHLQTCKEIKRYVVRYLLSNGIRIAVNKIMLP